MAESPPNPESPPPASPAVPSASRRRVAFLILPFLPIVLALGVALAIRPSPPSPRLPATTAATVEIGALAPDFTLQNASLQPGAPPISLSGLVKKGPVLLLFHRGLGCYQCYAFLQQVSEKKDDFANAGLQILAISADVTGAQDNPDFSFPLLEDPNNDVAFAYNLFDADGALLYGTFIVDKDRRIRFAARTQVPLSEAIEALLDEGRKLRQP